MTDFKGNTMPLFIITFIFQSWLFSPFSHKPTNCGVHVYFGHHHNNSMWAPTQPHNDFPFLCCYFCATGLCQDATRLGWPQRSNSGLVVVLGPSPGSQAGSPFQIQPFFPPFHPSFHSGNKTAPLWGGGIFSPCFLCTGIVGTRPHCTPN